MLFPECMLHSCVECMHIVCVCMCVYVRICTTYYTCYIHKALNYALGQCLADLLPFVSAGSVPAGLEGTSTVCQL